MFRFLWCPCPKRVPGRWEPGQHHLPDGKTHLPRTPNFPPFFAKQHCNPFSLIAWCQGAYFYKLILFSPSFLALETGPVLPARMAELTCAGEQAAVWQRPGPCLPEEEQEGSITIFSPWQKSRLGWNEETSWVRNTEEPLGTSKSYQRVGRKELFLPIALIQIIKYCALGTPLSTVTLQLLFCFPPAGGIHGSSESASHLGVAMTFPLYFSRLFSTVPRGRTVAFSPRRSPTPLAFSALPKPCFPLCVSSYGHVLSKCANVTFLLRLSLK